jgi:hypothetical protein
MQLAKLHPRHFWSTESGLPLFFLRCLSVLNSLSEYGIGRVVGRLLCSLIYCRSFQHV